MIGSFAIKIDIALISAARLLQIFSRVAFCRAEVVASPAHGLGNEAYLGESYGREGRMPASFQRGGNAGKVETLGAPITFSKFLVLACLPLLQSSVMKISAHYSI